MIHTPEIKDFIRRHSDLFWYTPPDKKDDISAELLVETVLNYGTLDDYKELENLMSVSVVSSVFFGMQGRKIGNFFPEIYNYFYLLFSKYAQRNSQ